MCARSECLFKKRRGELSRVMKAKGPLPREISERPHQEEEEGKREQGNRNRQEHQNTPPWPSHSFLTEEIHPIPSTSSTSPISRQGSSSPITSTQPPIFEEDLLLHESGRGRRTTKQKAKERISEIISIEEQKNKTSVLPYLVPASAIDSSMATPGRLMSGITKPVTRSTYPYPITRRYLSYQEISSFEGPMKLEILCEDKKHYHINFSRENASIILHFPHWNRRFDIITDDESIMEYFLTYRGRYSISDGRVPSTSSREETSANMPGSMKRPREESEIVVSTKRLATRISTRRSPRESNVVNLDSYPDEKLESPSDDINHYNSSGAIPEETLPLEWVGESIKMVCLDPSSNLNPAAKRYSDLTKLLCRGEIKINAYKRRNNEIDSEIDLVKSSPPSNPHLPPSALKHSETISHTREQKIRRLLEEKISKFEKVEIISKHQVNLSQQRDTILRYLSNNAMEIMRSHINEGIENFIHERQDGEGREGK